MSGTEKMGNTSTESTVQEPAFEKKVVLPLSLGIGGCLLGFVALVIAIIVLAVTLTRTNGLETRVEEFDRVMHPANKEYLRLANKLADDVLLHLRTNNIEAIQQLSLPPQVLSACPGIPEITTERFNIGQAEFISSANRCASMINWNQARVLWVETDFDVSSAIRSHREAAVEMRCPNLLFMPSKNEEIVIILIVGNVMAQITIEEPVYYNNRLYLLEPIECRWVDNRSQ